VTSEQQIICEQLFSESKARRFNSESKGLLSDGQIRRYWPDVDVKMFTLGLEFLRQRESINNPMVDGVEYAGLWRSAIIEVQHDQDETPRLVEVLREGYAPYLFDEEARNVSNKEFKDFEEVVVLRWPNLDTNKARVLRELILERDFNDTHADPDESAKAGTGALTVKGDE